MRQYIQVMKTSWQRSFTYKVNFIFSSILNVFRVVAEIIFWVVFFKNSGKTDINGYTLPRMITYYMLMYMVNTLVDMGEVGNSMAGDIKNGTLTQYILKPMNYLGYYFSEILSKRILQTGIALIVFFPVFAIGYSELKLNVKPEQLAIFPFILFSALILNYMMNVFIGYLAFWFVELTSFFFLKDILLGFVSGAVIPIDMLPDAVLHVMKGLPFMYIIYFPVKVLNKGVSNSELFAGISMQLLWIVIFYLLIKLLWKSGIRKYTGTGM